MLSNGLEIKLNINTHSLQKARGLADFGQQQQQKSDNFLPIYLTEKEFLTYFISGMFQSPPHSSSSPESST